MKIRSLTTLAALALFVGLWGSQPAVAESDIGVSAVQTQRGSYSFRKFEYPSKTSSFLMYPQSYVTFDAANGKFWSVESTRADYDLNFVRSGWADVFPPSDGRNALYPEKLRVSFYTPDLKLLGTFNKIRINHKYSIPRDGNNYERIIVRIECEAKENFDIKMSITEPVNSVIAEPIPQDVRRR